MRPDAQKFTASLGLFKEFIAIAGVVDFARNPFPWIAGILANPTTVLYVPATKFHEVPQREVALLLAVRYYFAAAFVFSNLNFCELDLSRVGKSFGTSVSVTFPVAAHSVPRTKTVL